MTMNSDFFLKVGKPHAICQDYIISNSSYIILSDGCSSAQNSEVGAMLLSYTAQNLFRMYLGQMEFKKAGELIIHNALMASRVLNSPSTCLDATLVIAVIFNGTIYVSIYGDGMVIWKDWNGHINYNRITYEKESPFYLSYLLSSRRMSSYSEKKFKKMVITGKIVPEKFCLNSPTLDSELEPDTPTAYGTHLTFPAHMVESLFISSDGLDSFKNQNGSSVSLEYVLKEALNFKKNQGEFIKRRMKRFTKTIEASGIYHKDDISIGGFIQETTNESTNPG